MIWRRNIATCCLYLRSQFRRFSWSLIDSVIWHWEIAPYVLSKADAHIANKSLTFLSQIYSVFLHFVCLSIEVHITPLCSFLVHTTSFFPNTNEYSESLSSLRVSRINLLCVIFPSSSDKKTSYLCSVQSHWTLRSFWILINSATRKFTLTSLYAQRIDFLSRSGFYELCARVPRANLFRKSQNY